MKKNLLILTLSLFAFMSQINAQFTVKPSGNIIEKSFDFKGFTTLELSNDFLAFVTMTDIGDKVKIKADDNLLKHITVEMEGTTLRIKLKDHLNTRGNATLKAYISSDLLNDFSARGDSEIYIENELKKDRVNIKLRGDSKFKGTLDVKTMELVLRGDSEMDVKGVAHAMKANLRGDSVIKSYDFKVDLLEIDLKGDSQAYLTVDELIDVVAAGDSELFYKGSAEVKRKRLVGDSEIHKKE